MVQLRDEEFEKDGRKIRFQRVYLTQAGLTAKTLSNLSLTPLSLPTLKRRKVKKQAKGKDGASRPRVTKASTERPAPGSSRLAEVLRGWRLSEAKRRKIPAFRILTNRSLEEIVRIRPRTASQLLDIHGVGPKVVHAYGETLIQLCARS